MYNNLNLKKHMTAVTGSATQGLSVVALMLAVACNATAKDPGDREADRLLGLTLKPMSAAVAARLVARSLPEWDESILDVSEQDSPLDQVGFEEILGAMTDEEGFEETPPEGAKRIKDKNHAIKLDREKGKMRYVNYARGWDRDRDGEKEQLSKRDAADVALKTLDLLGIKFDQLSRFNINLQQGVGGKPGSRRATERFDMYRLVSAARVINEIPVYDSGFKMAINHEGLVQRAGLNWRTFKMSPERTLRSKRAVINEAVEQIVDQRAHVKSKISSTLAYAALDEELYKPVMVISVEARPTPFQLLVPLTGFDKDDSGQ